MVPKGFRRKMIIVLMIVTPGIPEYMTGSTMLDPLLYSIPVFIANLLIDLALYPTGALLIREFSIRFNKGWGSILTLGLDYGIMEEGISAHTFFMSPVPPVGILGEYGRFMGVNWIWALGITVFHAIFSICLPLFLVSIAYPKYSREPLLGRRGVKFVLFIYLLDVVMVNLSVMNTPYRPMPTLAEYLFFTALTLILIYIAYLIPANSLSGKGDLPQGTGRFFLLGMIVFPLYLFNAVFPASPNGVERISPVLEALIFIMANLLVMIAITHYMPPSENRKHKFSLALGMITPFFFWAEFLQFTGGSLLITLVVIVALVMLNRLRKLVNSEDETTEQQQIPG